MKDYFKNNFQADFLSSIVVFLVALPLCMGISVASGVDPVFGLLSGVIGGLVVGAFAGCKLQVSGPAAGLAVMVFAFVEKFGIPSLAVLGIIVGLFQLLIYKFRLADFFRAISPALIKGMLAGIGAIILIGQLHIAMLSKPTSNGLSNIVNLGNAISNLVNVENAMLSFAIALLVTAIMFFQAKLLPKFSKKVPGALTAIIISAIVCTAFALDLKYVNLPDNIMANLHIIDMQSIQGISISMIMAALAIAFVATVESLLSVNAVDKLADMKSDYNKETMAQGLGNFVAGIFGVLPLTGVIVRSSANIESGGKTKMAAVMHGIWLLLLIAIFPHALSVVSISALAGILIMTGIKLLDFKGVIALYKKSKSDFIIFLATFLPIVCFDLLTGVVIGFVISLIVLIASAMQVEFKLDNSGTSSMVSVLGAVTYLHIPFLKKKLDTVALDFKDNVVFDFSKTNYFDDTAKDEISSWADDQNKNISLQFN
ncbi:MAG: SulP family inorganic anion transporter [Bacteriovoracaceae bacterium]|jgi:MFS superfamily sulfate permease-like transporter|nr:SulP family inorganic anion transporter [Bacteriovoracaceae bacterium]